MYWDADQHVQSATECGQSDFKVCIIRRRHYCQIPALKGFQRRDKTLSVLLVVGREGFTRSVQSIHVLNPGSHVGTNTRELGPVRATETDSLSNLAMRTQIKKSQTHDSSGLV
jgi:hypothetical protein